MNQNTLIPTFITTAISMLLFMYVYGEFSTQTLLGLTFFIFIGSLFFFQLGKSIPIKSLMLIIGGLQWIVGPVLAYYFFPDSEFYYMIVSEERYFGFVLPSFVVFGCGLFILGKGRDFKAKEALDQVFNNSDHYYKRGYFLIIVGFIATGLLKLGLIPPSLRYFVLLTSYFKMIGAFYVFASGARLRWVWILIAFGIEVLTAFGQAMFHDMILWAGYLFILYAFINKSGFWKKALILGTMAMSVFLIQSIKKDYRAVVWNERGMEDTDKIGLAVDIATAESSQADRFFGEENMQQFVDRINQGWIIGRILWMVPQYEPFADGETIRKGLKAALLPRFLAPDKARSGGHENFTRFTGIIIDEDTSMDLSILGEAYANYGQVGGTFFMFLLGLFYGLIFKLLTSKSSSYPELLFWIPFIFFYTVKAENDFATAFNQLIKSLIVLIGIIWLMNKIIPSNEEPV